MNDLTKDIKDGAAMGWKAAITTHVNEQFGPKTSKSLIQIGSRAAFSFMLYRHAFKTSSGAAKAWYGFGATTTLLSLILMPKWTDDLDAEKARRLDMLDPGQRLLLETGASGVGSDDQHGQ